MKNLFFVLIILLGEGKILANQLKNSLSPYLLQHKDNPYETSRPGKNAGAQRAAQALFIGFLKLAQKFVSAGDRIIHGLGCGFLAAPDGFQFFIDDIAHLNEIAKPDTA